MQNAPRAVPDDETGFSSASIVQAEKTHGEIPRHRARRRGDGPNTNDWRPFSAAGISITRIFQRPRETPAFLRDIFCKHLQPTPSRNTIKFIPAK